jgi:hypothetical protein
MYSCLGSQQKDSRQAVGRVLKPSTAYHAGPSMATYMGIGIGQGRAAATGKSLGDEDILQSARSL